MQLYQTIVNNNPQWKYKLNIVIQIILIAQIYQILISLIKINLIILIKVTNNSLTLIM